MTKLVVALDVPSAERARALVEALAPLEIMFKVGFEAHYGYGGEMSSLLEARGAEYFVDLKLHDIPRTVAAAVRALVRPGVAILDVHALGGNEMMRAAVEAAQERADELRVAVPAIFAVTILTSIAPEDLRELGLGGGPGENVIRLAALARDAGCSGVICSAAEVSDLKSFFGNDFLTLCPGVRPAGSSHGDQKRVVTPAQAVAAGADYIVVGRPITEAGDPAAAATAILDELTAASV